MKKTLQKIYSVVSIFALVGAMMIPSLTFAAVEMSITCGTAEQINNTGDWLLTGTWQTLDSGNQGLDKFNVAIYSPTVDDVVDVDSSGLDDGPDSDEFNLVLGGINFPNVPGDNDNLDDMTGTWKNYINFPTTPIAIYAGLYHAQQAGGEKSPGTTCVFEIVNGAPVATDDAVNTNEDVDAIIPVATLLANDTDPDNNPLSITAVSNPVNGSVLLSGTDVTFTPATNFSGSASFEYTVSDGALTDTAVVNVTVTSVNDVPVANDDSYNTNEDTALNVPATGVLSNDSDVENDALTSVLVSNVSNGTLTLNADGSFDYIPNLGFNGSDSFTYKANDGTDDSNVATATINVSSVNDAPVAVADGYNMNEDGVLNISAPGILSNDSDADNDSLTAVLGTNVTNGTLTLNADGSFDYTPNANWSGVDTFTYTATDGTFSSSEVTVTITVESVNDAPVANDDSVVTNEDTPVSDNLSATDVELSALTYAITANPTKGTLTVFDANTGAYTYKPNVNANGADSFKFTANDGSLTSNEATISITINPVNDIPVVTLNGSAEVVIEVGGTFTDQGASCYDVEDSEISPVITGTVDANTPGSYIITYTCTDSNEASDSTTRTVTVSEKPAMCADGIDNDEDGKTDYPNDPGCENAQDNDETDPVIDMCVNFEGIQTEVPQGMIKDGNVCYTPGSGSGGSAPSPVPAPTPAPAPAPTPAPAGEVLGAETACGIYVDKFLRKGYKNNKDAVLKVQQFLNQYEGNKLSEDGFYGLGTENAVKSFQQKYADDILKPWKINKPTGIFYLTTQTKVNNIMCPELALPIPQNLVPFSKNVETPKA